MKKILLVDDDKYIRQLLREELEEDGYHVSTAKSGKDALFLLNSLEKPDVVILELRMPGINGLDIIDHMLKLKHRIPMIIFCSLSSYKNNPLAMAADAYVVKSSDMSELKNKIRKLT